MQELAKCNATFDIQYVREILVSGAFLNHVNKKCYLAYGSYLIGFDNARVITLAHKIHIFSNLFL
jgi:hypothetical protein